MNERAALPTFARIERALTSVPPFGWVILKMHQHVRKRWYVERNRRRDAVDRSNLRNFERRVFSQYGEDGILWEIFDRIGDGSRIAVEFGIETGEECNTRNLVENRGWSAVQLDGSPEYVAAARTLYAGRPVRVVEAFLTAENINGVLDAAGVPTEFDLLSVDVDGNDYWLLKAVLAAYRPRVIVVEYNGRWVPPMRWVMPYDPSHAWDGSVYFGASLQSLAELAAERDYALVGCSSTGLNAFFLRRDQLDAGFRAADRSPSYHYAAPLYCAGFGHPLEAPRRG